jgi:cell division protein FtsB
MKLPRKSGRWVIGILVVLFLYLFLTGNNGLFTIIRSRFAVHQTEKDLIELIQTKDSLKTVVKMLKNDTNYIERVAREKLGMAKKNEKVYKFIDE